jgi:hypothetical protein
VTRQPLVAFVFDAYGSLFDVASALRAGMFGRFVPIGKEAPT